MGTNEAARRKLTPLNAWAFSFACMIGWAAFVMPATVFLPKGGVAGSVLAFLAAAAAMSVVSLNYHFLGTLYPERGGIYHLVKHSINRDHAFAASWAMGLAHLCCIPLNAQALGMVIRTVLEEYFDFRFRLHLFRSDILMVDAVAIVVTLVVLGFINVRGIRQSARIQTVGAIVLLAGIAIMLAATLWKAGNPARLLAPAYYPGTRPARSFMMIFILMPWAYVGFDSVSKVSREFDFPNQKLGGVMIVSVLCGTFAYLANLFTAILGMPEKYVSWPAYLYNLNRLSGIDAYPVLSAARSAMGGLGIVVFFASGFCAILTGLIGFSVSISRLVCQMAEDGVLPPVLARRDPKRGTPANAIWLVVGLSFVLVLLIRAYESIEELASVATAVGYGYCSCAALVMARRRRSAKYTVTGALGLCVCAFWVTFQLVHVPGLSSAISAQAVVFVALWCFLGIATYAVCTRRRDDAVRLDGE